MLKTIIENIGLKYIEIEDSGSYGKILNLYKKGIKFNVKTKIENLYVGSYYYYVVFNIPKSMKYYKQGEKLGCPFSIFNLAQHENKLGNYNKAIKYLKHVQNIEPSLTNMVNFSLSEIYKNVNKTDSAICMLQNLIKLDYNKQDCIKLLLNIYIQENKWHQAIQLLKPEKLNKHVLKLLKIYYNMQNFDNAIPLCKKLISVNYKRETCIKLLLDMYIQQNKMDQAMDIVKTYISKENISVLLKIYQQLNKHEEAMLLVILYPDYLHDQQIVEIINRLPFPVVNKIPIYKFLETWKFPSYISLHPNVVYILQDVISTKCELLCKIAYYYKNVPKISDNVK